LVPLAVKETGNAADKKSRKRGQATMNVSGIANLASSMAQAQTGQDIGIAVLKKALDAETSIAAGLIAAIPSVPSVTNLPSHLGRHINTSA